jgi:tripartite-type tricarboxylate transporter receptor subunit TctC
MPTRRALGLLALAMPGIARAQSDYPDRAVKVVVPFGPGGAIDILARVMAPHFPALANGQQLLVENRPGAGGTIGVAGVASARPDGYSLLLAEQASGLLAHELYRSLPYDPRTAFTPICFLVDLPEILVVRKDLPARNVAELMAMARAEPGKVSFGTVGVGHIGHLTAELLGSRAGPDTRMLNVVYRSGADMVTAVAKGELDFTCTTLSSASALVQAGAIRWMAVSTPKRIAALPDVPTFSETWPDTTSSLWYGMVGPAGMPPTLVQRLNRICNSILAIPEVRDSLVRQMGAELVGGPPERFAQHLAAELARWTPLLRAQGIKVE